jgi:hypothetical protein
MSTGGPLGHRAGSADRTDFGRLAEIPRARQLVERGRQAFLNVPPPW